MGEESPVVIYFLTEGNSGDLVKRPPISGGEIIKMVNLEIFLFFCDLIWVGFEISEEA